MKDPVDNLLIPLRSGDMFHVEQAMIDQYSTLYPDLDVKQQIRALAAWNQANPARRKTAGGIKRHINSWLSKANQEGQPSEIPGQFKGSPEWHHIASAYFRPLRQEEVQVWEYEMSEMLGPDKGQKGPKGLKRQDGEPDSLNEEIISTIRAIVSDPQGKPAYLDAWMLIKAIKAARKAASAADLTAADISAYVASIEAEKDLLTRWDMICDHPNPMKIEAALNQANIAFARPSTAIQAAQDAADKVKFKFRLI